MEGDPKTYEPNPPGGFFFIGWVAVVVVILGLTAGLVLARGLRLNRQTAALEQKLQAGPRVLVQPVSYSPRTRTIAVPGSIHGYVEVPVYAKIAGYLERLQVDKGDHVKAGQLIGVIDSPELDHQVNNARATYQLARVTDHRNQALRRSDVIAQQMADDSHARMLEAKATLDQLLAMQKYKELRAPFSGLITARYVDPGALIPQSTSPATASTPVVAMATLSPLRVYADVPQSSAPFIRDGDPAVITVSEYPNRKFTGKVTRHPSALASATRTMLVEVDLSNDDHVLFPGMYASIEFEVKTPEGVPMVPDDALVFRNGKSFVPVVRNNRLKLAEVTLGYDNGINVEVTQGVSGQDMVAINVGQSARDGEPVHPITAQ